MKTSQNYKENPLKNINTHPPNITYNITNKQKKHQLDQHFNPFILCVCVCVRNIFLISHKRTNMFYDLWKEVCHTRSRIKHKKYNM